MEITKVKDGKKTYDVLTVEGSFERAYPALRKEGVEIATAEQIARMRRLSGSDSSLSRNYGQWVAEAHIYQPKDSGIVLIVDGNHNPILANPSEATNRHRKGKEFYVDNSKLLNRAEKDAKKAVKSGVLALPRQRKSGLLGSSEINPIEVSTDELAEHPYFQFTLRDEAKPYGKFLKEAGISKIPVYLVSENSTKDSEHNGNPFVRLLWVGCLDDGSGFYGVRGLGYDGSRVRGVRVSTEGASSQKSRSNGHQKITRPNLEQVLKTVRPFVAEANKADVKNALKKLYR